MRWLRKPRGLIGDPQDAVELMRRAAFFRTAKEVDGLKHLVEGNAAMLENGPDFDRELLPAFLLIALP